ncbi:hypothetical protein EIP91_010289 [Steccherinum ochraceum]|uniref:Fido domain-containing protein n=1 Tax=Steccherinum ochraceum TaxID=92696 RepID=A0A4R0RZF5_9APHY|nr:hypothetical protein EIP91_010289 [Steccherinum ochraceum]
MAPHDRDEMLRDGDAGTVPDLVRRYEKMHALYPQLPYFTARLGDLFRYMGSEALAVVFYTKAKDDLYELGDDDDVLNNLVLELGMQALTVATSFVAGPYHQTWRATALHDFPSILPLPDGHEDFRREWLAIRRSDPEMVQMYTRKLVIDSNYLEGIFRLTDESVNDIIRKGVAEGRADCESVSSITDPVKAKAILNDMLSVYDVIFEIADKQRPIHKDLLCKLHRQFMDTCRFVADNCYVASGITRSETLRTSIIRGEYPIQLCPYADVDKELVYICNYTNANMQLKWKNPFAAASWLHLVLVRCHPFEDGNGRLSRMIASLPLLQNGYPPISLSLSLQEEYHRAIGKAYFGDHGPLAAVFLKGMQESLAVVQALFYAAFVSILTLKEIWLP